MTQEIKNVEVDGEVVSVVAYFQDDPNEVEWYDILDASGFSLAPCGFSEIPSDERVAQQVRMLKLTQL